MKVDPPAPPDDLLDAPRVLVVDDEKVIREILSDFLSMEGYIVSAVEDGAAALTQLRLRPFDLVPSDLKMPNLGGLELLERIAAENINVLTVIMSGFGTVETAIEAMKKGAYDYLLKPFKVEEVIHVVQRGLERQRLQAENLRLREALSLYRVSEAMAASLDVETVLDVVIQSVMQEVNADVVTLHLRDPHSEDFQERIRKVNHASEVAQHPTIAQLDITELLACFHDDHPVVSHGIRVQRFFSRRASTAAGCPRSPRCR